MTRSITKAAVLAVLAAVSLSACGRHDVASEQGATPAVASSSQADWCLRGGMDAAKDPRCKQQADKDFNKFIGKGGGS